MVTITLWHTLFFSASGAVHLVGNFPPSCGTWISALRARPRSDIWWRVKGCSLDSITDSLPLLVHFHWVGHSWLQHLDGRILYRSSTPFHYTHLCSYIIHTVLLYKKHYYLAKLNNSFCDITALPLVIRYLDNDPYIMDAQHGCNERL